MTKQVRVRFAPSPTGGLHIGGLRTALFNFLFAKKHQGTFILRIEDTDQTRFVEESENYINEALNWCGITPDEGVIQGGEFAPYKQSQRTDIYEKYVQQLLDSGHAYYAFDTAEELNTIRTKLEASKITFQYNAIMRQQLKNSLTLSNEEVQKRINNGDPYTVRFKMPTQEEIRAEDLIRGSIKVQSHTLDDKVLLKSDGLPTYHMANIVDDHLMKISHVIRGEEWIPSLPLHVMLYKALGWEDSMPKFAHLPLILKPTGKGKLSKRDAEKGNFPIFPLSWNDAKTGNTTVGFRESGYLPETMINFLAFLGWNDGTERELFTLDELINAFSLEKITKSGAKFDIEKAKWLNQQYLRTKDSRILADVLKKQLDEQGIVCESERLLRITDLVKERITFVDDLWIQAAYFFHAPISYDEKIVKKRWTQDTVKGLSIYQAILREEQGAFDAAASTEKLTQALAAEGMKIGRIMQPLRLALTGQGVGPDIMEVLGIFGSEEIQKRIQQAVDTLPIKDS